MKHTAHGREPHVPNDKNPPRAGAKALTFLRERYEAGVFTGAHAIAVSLILEEAGIYAAPSVTV